MAYSRPMDGQQIEYCNTERKERLRIVLLGATGEGKSATGNSILNENVFKSSCSGTSITLTCSSKQAQVFDRDIQVVDTPGLFDTRRDNKVSHLEIIKCIHMTIPGPHCFLLIVAPGRFTKEHKESVEFWFQHFGNDVHRFFIIVFTKSNDIESNGITLEDYITSLPSDFKAIIEKCNHRFTFLDNKAPGPERFRQVRNLLDMVDRLVHKNGGYYTNEMYSKAEEEYKRREEKVRKEMEQKKEQEIQEIKHKIIKDFEEKQKRETEQIRETLLKEKEMEIKELERKSIESLRIQLNNALGQMQRENEELKRKLRHMVQQQNQVDLMDIIERSTNVAIGIVRAACDMAIDMEKP